ncbi:MAG: hypothetical protein KDF60_13425 [Calditrichaeota bacterium]|nr:hypothetical protein [Calditrichota bacterium]
MRRLFQCIVVSFIIVTVINSCAAFRSDINGQYFSEKKHIEKKNVKVLFDFFYYTRETGKDAIPKIRAYSGVSDFNDIFAEALKHISNIREYETFYNLSEDINDPERRVEKEEKTRVSDYVIQIEILQENSFSKHALGYLISTCSLDLIPIGYTWDYTITTSIINNNGETIGKYSRSSSMTNWCHVLLVVLYPFHPIEAKTESIYLESLTNLFTEIENENILK